MRAATKVIPQLTDSDKLRFFKKIDRNGPIMPGMPDRCWQWTAGKDVKGRGKFKVGRIDFVAPRIAHILAGGVFTEEKNQANHICANPSCCHPIHIYAGSAQENAFDMVRHGGHGSKTKPERVARGERSGQAKLTDAQVLYALTSPMTQQAVANELGVSQPLISAIRSGKHRPPIPSSPHYD